MSEKLFLCNFGYDEPVSFSWKTADALFISFYHEVKITEITTLLQTHKPPNLKKISIEFLTKNNKGTISEEDSVNIINLLDSLKLFSSGIEEIVFQYRRIKIKSNILAGLIRLMHESPMLKHLEMNFEGSSFEQETLTSLLTETTNFPNCSIKLNLKNVLISKENYVILGKALGDNNASAPLHLHIGHGGFLGKKLKTENLETLKNGLWSSSRKEVSIQLSDKSESSSSSDVRNFCVELLQEENRGPERLVLDLTNVKMTAEELISLRSLNPCTKTNILINALNKTIYISEMTDSISPIYGSFFSEYELNFSLQPHIINKTDNKVYIQIFPGEDRIYYQLYDNSEKPHQENIKLDKIIDNLLLQEIFSDNSEDHKLISEIFIKIIKNINEKNETIPLKLKSNSIKKINELSSEESLIKTIKNTPFIILDLDVYTDINDLLSYLEKYHAVLPDYIKIKFTLKRYADGGYTPISAEVSEKVAANILQLNHFLTHARQLSIHYDDIQIYIPIIESLITSINKCQRLEELDLSFSNTGLTRVKLRKLTDSITQGKLTNGTSLNLSLFDNPMTDEDCSGLADVVCNDNFFSPIHLQIGSYYQNANVTREEGVNAIKKALLNSKNEKINITFNKTFALKYIVNFCEELFADPRCPAYLSLDLSLMDLSEKELCRLLEAIKNPNCPKTVNLKLPFNNLNENLILPNNIQQNITLKLNFTSSHKKLLKIIENNSCFTNSNFTIDLTNNTASEKIKKQLQQILARSYPIGFHIIFSDNNEENWYNSSLKNTWILLTNILKTPYGTEAPGVKNIAQELFNRIITLHKNASPFSSRKTGLLLASILVKFQLFKEDLILFDSLIKKVVILLLRTNKPEELLKLNDFSWKTVSSLLSTPLRPIELHSSRQICSINSVLLTIKMHVYQQLFPEASEGQLSNFHLSLDTLESIIKKRINESPASDPDGLLILQNLITILKKVYFSKQDLLFLLGNREIMSILHQQFNASQFVFIEELMFSALTVHDEEKIHLNKLPDNVGIMQLLRTTKAIEGNMLFMADQIFQEFFELMPKVALAQALVEQTHFNSKIPFFRLANQRC